MMRHYIVELKLLSYVCFVLEELRGVHFDSFTFFIHHRAISDNSIGSIDVLHLLAEILDCVLERLLGF
jgi:hypothetical protein